MSVSAILAPTHKPSDLSWYPDGSEITFDSVVLYAYGFLLGAAAKIFAPQHPAFHPFVAVPVIAATSYLQGNGIPYAFGMGCFHGNFATGLVIERKGWVQANAAG
jgi:hypothetical protein